ncbi:MAG TPA: TlpA disulfide reductase family protein [Gemmatimonadaceae bacterium]|jgi:thiol-disulfide isomerase/thioredoxin
MKSGTRVAMALALGALAASVPARGAQAQIGIAVGARAPGAAVTTLDGKPVNLSQFIGTKPVMMTFWATWCSNCKELEPKFLSLVKQYSPRVTFIDVAVSVNQSPDRVKRYAEKYHYTHEMLYDTNGDAVTAYDVPATSYVVLVDRSGKVVYTGLGGDQDLAAALKKVL